MRIKQPYVKLLILALLLTLLVPGDLTLAAPVNPGPEAFPRAWDTIPVLDHQEADIRAPRVALAPSASPVNIEFVGHVGGVTEAVFVEGNYAYIGEGPQLDDPGHLQPSRHRRVREDNSVS